MKLELTTTESLYNDNEIEKLKPLGFEFNFKNGGYWKTHKEVFIEINSIDELMDFIKKYGRIVIEDNVIEIYDDYRE